MPGPDADAWVPDPEVLTALPPEPEPPRTLLDLDPTSAHAVETLAGGWSAAPGEFAAARVWSHGDASSLRFDLDRARPHWLELTCAPFTYPDSPEQVLSLRLNGVDLGGTRLRDGFHDYRVRLPGSALRAGYNALELRYAYTARPVEVLPDSRDPRPLAVAFRRIALVPEPAARAVELTRSPGGVPRPGWLQAGGGSFAQLLAVPPGARLELGVLGPADADAGPARVRVAAETDDAVRTLWEAEVGAELERTSADLADLAGRAVRLHFAVDGLAAGGRVVWVEPRLHPGPQSAAPPGLPPSPEAPVAAGDNALVIVLDAATRSRLGTYGGAEGVTPNLDALAGESLVFERAHSQAAYTLASTASLFTSLLPARHGVVRKHHKLDAELPTLASALRAAGYETVGISANGFASPTFGMDSGFERFETVAPDLREAHVASPEAVRAAFERWLDGFAAGPEPRPPFFAYLHFIQPHEPYDVAPARFYRDLDPGYDGPVDGSTRSMLRIHRDEIAPTEAETRRLRRLYEGNLRHADAVVGGLLDGLRERGLLDETVVVVTADHGEALGEHDFFGHNYSLQEEVTAIPLLMRFPAAADLTGRLERPAASIDVGPTLLAALGVEAPPSFEGRDLLAGRSDAGGARIVFSRSAHDRPAAAVWFGDFKYVRDFSRGGRSLRRRPDWDAGPDVAAAHPVTFAFLDRVRATLERRPPALRGPDEAAVSPETREALEALGYVLE